MSHTLIVLPDDTAKPIVDAINGAAAHAQRPDVPVHRSDAAQGSDCGEKPRRPCTRDVESCAAQRRKRERGVTQDHGRRRHRGPRQQPRLRAHPPKIHGHRWTTGFVESLNWETRDLTETRDYAVVTTHKIEVDEMVKVLRGRLAPEEPFEPDPKSPLIWCPNNGRERIAASSTRPKNPLWLQNERYQDTVIIERLVRAANRGVHVHIMARPPHKLKKEKLVEGVGGLRIMHDVGAKVHKLKGLKLHGKMLLADEERAIVGSINLAPGSFDARRELAVQTDAGHVIKRLMKTTRLDWENSHPLDLSDEGLLADLEKHGAEGADKLAIGADQDKKKHSKH